MISCIIIDDNELAIKTLNSLILNFCPQLNVMATSQTITNGVNLINEHQPELVFLDVEIKTELSFDLFSYFSKPKFKVIFTTAHEKYALSAIKHKCFGYLLKPIDAKELVRLVNDFENHKTSISNETNSTEEKRLALIENNEYFFVNMEDILYLNADGKYTEIVLSNKTKHVSSKNLGEIEALLPSYFFKCHKAYIINMNSVTKFIKDDMKIVMKDGVQIDLAARRKDEFLKQFNRV
jgi:two-component system, LytTR family, response regulator